MKVGTVNHGFASCRLGMNNLVRPDISENLREISHVYVDPLHRKKGEGSRLIDRLVKQADQQGTALMVLVEPFGDSDMTRDQLQAWYEKFGFVALQSEPRILIRLPR